MPAKAPSMAQLANALEHHLADCMEQRKTNTRALDSLAEEFKTLNRTAWRAVGAVGLVILTGMIALFVQQYQGHQEAAAHTDRAAAQVTRYSAADAERDRQAAAQREADILNAIEALKKGRR